MNSEKKGIGGLQASLTVEACFVASLTVIVLTAFLFCAFYVHDRAVLQGLVCETASAGSNGLTAEERGRSIDCLKEKIVSSRFLGSRGLKGTAREANGRVEASGNGNFPVPGMVMKFFSGNRLTLSASWDCEIKTPAESIRKIRGLADLAEEALE